MKIVNESLLSFTFTVKKFVRKLTRYVSVCAQVSGESVNISTAKLRYDRYDRTYQVSNNVCLKVKKTLFKKGLIELKTQRYMKTSVAVSIALRCSCVLLGASRISMV